MNVVGQIRRNQFLRHNAIFLFGSVIVGALNYLYYPVLGRLLSPGTFGEVQTLVSLFLQLSIFLTVASMVVVHIVANQDTADQRNSTVFEFEKLTLFGALVLLVLSILCGPLLQDWLRFQSPWPFTIMVLAIVVSVPFALRSAYARGRQKFGLVVGGNIITAAGKLLASTALVLLGLGTIGAIGGIVLAQLAACIFIGWRAYRLGLRLQAKRRLLPDIRLLAPELRYGGVVLIVSLAITLQYSIDIVLVKHYFDAHTAGLYAGVSAVARILFFLTASISQVLIPKITHASTAAENEATFWRSLMLLAGVSIVPLALLMLFPAQIVQLLMGKSYTGLAALLPQLSLSVCIVAIVNLVATYYLALRRYHIALPVCAGVILTYLLILLHHGSPNAIVTNLLLGSSAALVATGVWILTERRYGPWNAKR